MPDRSRFRDTADFAPTIDAASEHLGISATAVEKDYWVSEVLRVLAHEFPDDFIFKGGTSLSKAYRLIQRFSEDIDVLVLPGDRGRTATDSLMKRMGERAAKGIGGQASPVGGAEKGIHRSYEISYPTTRHAMGIVRTSVLLEMGVRGGNHPSELASIGCLLGDVLAGTGTILNHFSDLEPFEILVLHPGRTLIEKLTYVHGEAQRLAANPTLIPNQRIGRHFYDIHELLGDDRARRLLADRDTFDRILAEIDEVTGTHFRQNDEVAEICPPDGFSASPAFRVDSDVSQRFRTAYEATMPELYFGSDPFPRWETICESAINARDLL